MKAIDVASDHGDVAALVWLAVCLVAPFHRAGFAALAVTAWGGWALADGNMASTHAVLIGWVALILAVDRDVSYLLRMQVVALYLFATLNKLNSDFLAGEPIAGRAPEWVPLVPAAVAAVLTEGWLAWAVYRRHRFALPVAVMLHGGIVVLMGTDLYQWTMLAAYNGLVILLVWATCVRPTQPA